MKDLSISDDNIDEISENDDINKYFNQATSVNQNKLENKQ